MSVLYLRQRSWLTKAAASYNHIQEYVHVRLPKVSKLKSMLVSVLTCKAGDNEETRIDMDDVVVSVQFSEHPFRNERI